MAISAHPRSNCLRARHDGQVAELEKNFTATRAVWNLTAYGDEAWASLNEDRVGGLLHYDGRGWTDSSALATVEAFHGVWGAAADDVWAVGTRGHKAHFDGQGWSLHVNGTENASDIWGSASDNVWVVGAEGAIEHYDGQTWTEHARVEDDLAALWGTAPDSLWIHGQYGVHHYKNGSLRSFPDSPGVWFFGDAKKSIWASSDDDVWVAAGQLYHFDGDSWSVAFDTGTGSSFDSVWGRGPGDVFVAGFDGVFRGGQGTFTRIEDSNGVSPSFARQIGGCGAHLWIADTFGFYSFDGTALMREPGTWPDVRGVWGASPERLVAVGARGSLLRRQP